MTGKIMNISAKSVKKDIGLQLIILFASSKTIVLQEIASSVLMEHVSNAESDIDLLL
jgi:hypothetical protein